MTLTAFGTAESNVATETAETGYGADKTTGVKIATSNYAAVTLKPDVAIQFAAEITRQAAADTTDASPF